MITIGIVGGTGYTGVELLRLLAQHPEVDVRVITSRKDAGTRVADMFPSLRGRCSLAFADPAEVERPAEAVAPLQPAQPPEQVAVLVRRRRLDLLPPLLRSVRWWLRLILLRGAVPA